jgi:hypothetical protein
MGRNDHAQTHRSLPIEGMRVLKRQEQNTQRSLARIIHKFGNLWASLGI